MPVLLRLLAVVVFLSAIRVTATAQDSVEWTDLNPETAGFFVEMPGKINSQTRTIRPAPDKKVAVYLFTTSAKEGKAVFLVAYHDLEELPTTEEKQNDVLNGGVKGSVLNANGQLSKHEKITIDDNPGRHVEYEGKRFNQKIKATSRIFLVEKRIYQITSLQDPDVDVDDIKKQFFDSFKLVDSAKANSTSNGKSAAADDKN